MVCFPDCTTVFITPVPLISCPPVSRVGNASDLTRSVGGHSHYIMDTCFADVSIPYPESQACGCTGGMFRPAGHSRTCSDHTDSQGVQHGKVTGDSTEHSCPLYKLITHPEWCEIWYWFRIFLGCLPVGESKKGETRLVSTSKVYGHSVDRDLTWSQLVNPAVFFFCLSSHYISQQVSKLQSELEDKHSFTCLLQVVDGQDQEKNAESNKRLINMPGSENYTF